MEVDRSNPALLQKSILKKFGYDLAAESETLKFFHVFICQLPETRTIFLKNRLHLDSRSAPNLFSFFVGHIG